MNFQGTSDVSRLPTSAYGHVTPQWWGVVGMIAIEGTIFGLCVASYFYLRTQTFAGWPPRPIPMPDLLPGLVNTFFILLGLLSVRAIERPALRMDRNAVLMQLSIFLALNLVILAIRFFEFRGFHVKWDTNAYGSVVWITLIFHTLHLFTTFLEKAVLMAYLGSHDLDEKRALDLQLNRVYWDFVAGSWLVLFAVLYIGPRVLN